MGFKKKQLQFKLGLDQTEHMSFLTGQDRTHKVAGQVLPDWTESGLILLNILPMYQVQIINSHKIRFLDIYLESKVPRPNG